MVLVDDFLYGKCQRHPSKHRSNFELDSISDCDNTDDRVDRTLDALSLESRVIWQAGSVNRTFTLQRLRIPEPSKQIVDEVLDELLDEIVDRGERDKREKLVENYLVQYLPAPLVQRQEVKEMGAVLSSTRSAIQLSSSRLHAAWKIILVSTVQQLLTSYRRILQRRNQELNVELDSYGIEPRPLLTDAHGVLVYLLQLRLALDHTTKESCPEIISPLDAVPAHETEGHPLVNWTDVEVKADDVVQRHAGQAVAELSDVTDRILELAVSYLKNASRDVVDAAVEGVKDVLCAQVSHQSD